MDKFQSGKYKFSSVKPLFLIGNYVIEGSYKRFNFKRSKLFSKKWVGNYINVYSS